VSRGAAWLPADVPDRTHLVPLPQGRVFVVDVGPAEGVSASQPPLVLLHGVFVTHFAFHRLIPRLSSARRIIAIDLPGTGDSDHPDPELCDEYSFDWLSDAVLQTLDTLDVGTFDLLGHDYGGSVALAMTAAHPERVRRLILAAPLALSVSLPLEGSLGFTPALGPEVFKRVLRRADLTTYLGQCVSAPELVSETTVDVYWDRLGREGAREATYAMLGQVASLVRMRERFASVSAPTLLVWGDRDRIVGHDQGERLVELLPKATLETIDGCGHNLAEERPEELARLVERHTG
jgi:pimeloyl-ACP methyl ester carboxylesterase